VWLCKYTGVRTHAKGCVPFAYQLECEVALLLSMYHTRTHSHISKWKRASKLRAANEKEIKMEATPLPPIVRAVACPCVSPSNESRVVFAEMAPGARGGGVNFRTRPRKQGGLPGLPASVSQMVAGHRPQSCRSFPRLARRPGPDRRCTLLIALCC
jgi:hypothetical protein